ncbi:hypothetical protein ACRQ2P_004438, partial [Escherichia coli]
IHLVQPLQESFRRNDSLCSLVEDPVFIQALYAERRQDRNGPYTCLMSITLN